MKRWWGEGGGEGGGMTVGGGEGEEVTVGGGGRGRWRDDWSITSFLPYLTARLPF